MATVVANKTTVSMKMVFDKGINEATGKPKTQVKSFSNIRNDATDENIYLSAQKLASMQKNPVTIIRKQETYELVSE